MEVLDKLSRENRNFDFYWYPRSDEVKIRCLNPPGEEKDYGAFARLAKDETGPPHEVIPQHSDLPHRFEEMEYSMPAEAGPECLGKLRADQGKMAPLRRLASAFSLHQGRRQLAQRGVWAGFREHIASSECDAPLLGLLSRPRTDHARSRRAAALGEEAQSSRSRAQTPLPDVGSLSRAPAGNGSGRAVSHAVSARASRLLGGVCGRSARGDGR